MRIPDFFIGGAPKCGTTAMHSYLRQHPRVFMPEKKEPHFFSTDLNLPLQNVIRDRDAYLRLFAQAPPAALLGEASATYLYSEVAMAKIMEENPQAKIIVMLRNPVDMAYSYHSQQLINLNENVADFAAAWALQEQRRQGRALSRHCTDPKILQYKEVCAFAGQIRRFYKEVPRQNRLVCIFEEFVRDPRRAYEQALAFLGLPSDGRTSFPRVNANKTYRSKALNRIVRYPPPPFNHIFPPMKRAFNALGLRPRLWVEHFNAQQTRRPPLNGEFRRLLKEEFAPEIAELEELLGRRLDLWRESPHSRPPAGAHA